MALDTNWKVRLFISFSYKVLVSCLHVRGELPTAWVRNPYSIPKPLGPMVDPQKGCSEGVCLANLLGTAYFLQNIRPICRTKAWLAKKAAKPVSGTVINLYNRGQVATITYGEEVMETRA